MNILAKTQGDSDNTELEGLLAVWPKVSEVEMPELSWQMIKREIKRLKNVCACLEYI